MKKELESAVTHYTRKLLERGDYPYEQKLDYERVAEDVNEDDIFYQAFLEAVEQAARQVEDDIRRDLQDGYEQDRETEITNRILTRQTR